MSKFNRYYLLITLLLIIGLAWGLRLFFTLQAELEIVQTTLNSLQQKPSTALPVNSSEVDTPATPTDFLTAQLDTLTTQLQTERMAMRTQIERLQTQLSSLEQKLTKSTLAHSDRRQQPDQAEESLQRIDANRFAEAGFDSASAADLAQRWSDREMNLLYLRDQALREGWADTAEYRQAVRDLRQDDTHLREELGDDDYARYLYALGESNRVKVDAVIDNSPAQLAGLQEGDRIIRYDDASIYNQRDLRNASSSGEADVPIPVQVVRDGTVIEIVIPRGPLGVMISPVSELSES